MDSTLEQLTSESENGVFASLADGLASEITVLEDGSSDLPEFGEPPAEFILNVGVSQISNQVVNAAFVPDLPESDVDVVTFVVPEGTVLSSLFLSGFESTDNLGFLAIQAGDEFTVDLNVPPAEVDTASLLGLANFGIEGEPNATVGTNILPAIGAGGGLLPPEAFIGFDGDAGLGPGTFTLLVQQLGGLTIDYSLEFIVNEIDDPAAGFVSLEGVEDLTGSAAADVLIGDKGDNLLDGAGGADTLFGEDGDDTFISDALDTIDGSEGIDTVDFSSLTTGIIVDLDVESAGALGAPGGQNGGILAAPPTIDENGAEAIDNILQEIDDVENIIGTDFDDLLIGNNESNEIQGGAGDDILAGVAADDILDGGEGNDTALFTFAPLPITVDLAIEGPQLIGPPGTDTLISIENVSGSDFAADTLLGNDEDNVLSGLAFDDVLDGRGGSDTLLSGDGDDVIISDALDTIDGGDGIDTVEFAGVDGVFASLTDGLASEITILEDGSSDLPEFGETPAEFILDVGVSQISNQVVNAAFVPDLPESDVDVFTFVVPEGTVLSSLFLSGFESVDNLGFLAIQAGDEFTVDLNVLPAEVDTASLLGLANFGIEGEPNATVGTNILPAIGAGGGLLPPEAFIGFDGDAGLGPGTFTLLVQQLGGLTIDYDLEFIVNEIDDPTAGFASLENIENLTGSAAADVLVGDDGDNVLDGGDAVPAFSLLDFETAADSEALTAGTVITDQFEGVTISTPINPFGAVIFDSANPTGGDFDLETTDQGNILIISEDGDASDPDDNAGAGILRFDFDTAVDVASIDLLDVEEEGVVVRLLDETGSLIEEVDVDPAGDNQQQTVLLDTDDVSSLELAFVGSGAVTGLTFAESTSVVDTLIGGAGDDLLISDGIDTINGGEGTDTIDLSGLTSGVVIDLDLNTPIPGPATQDGAIVVEIGGEVIAEVDDVENIIGTDFDDVLFGNNEINVIEGGAGDDVVHSFAGADTVDGGAGIDTVLFAAGGGMTVDLDDDGNAAASVGGAVADTLISIENITGSAVGDDNIAGNAGVNILNGQGGDDFLNGEGGDDTLIGGDGSDVFIFEAGSGVDTVLDFAIADDVLAVDAFFGSAEEALGAVSQVNSDTILALDSENSIILAGVDSTQLTLANFV